MLRRSPDPLLLVLLAVSLTANVFLYRHYRPTMPLMPESSVGQQVPEFVDTSLGGGTVPVRFNKPVVLYVFSPSCVWCDRNLDNARRLESHVAGKYQFVAVALESKNLREYVAKNGLEWTIVANISPEVQKAYGMAGTPQTILIDSGGTVRHVWSGAFLGASASEIEQVFGVKLPGLKG